MKTEIEQINELAARVEKLEKADKRKAEANYYWDKALEELRQYATMKAFGTYVENKGQKNECLMSVGFNDRESYMESFAINAKYNADLALKSEVM